MTIDHASDRDVFIAQTDTQIASTFEVMHQLRPNLVREDYVRTVRTLMDEEGYRVAALTDAGEVRAVVGFRVITMLYRGRILYVDDLVTDANARSKGYGARVLAWLQDEARRRACVEIQLISRLIRVDAHRFYQRNGFRIECLHLLADVADTA